MCRKLIRFFTPLLFISYSLFFSPAYSQTPSADCSTAGAQQLNVWATCIPVSFTIDDANLTPAIVACTGETPAGDDGWGWFIATDTVTTVDYDNTNRDAVIYIYSGTCASLTLIDCASDITGTGVESVTLTTIIGNTYFVRIVRLTGTSGNMAGNICVWNSASHCSNGIQDADETAIDCGGADCSACAMNCTDNGDCSTAQPLTFTTLNADTDYVCITDCDVGASSASWNFQGACPDITNTETVYYSFTATHTYININLTNAASSQPQLILLNFDCSLFSACEVGAGGSVSILQSQVTTGDTYNVMITSQTGETGTFSFCIYNYSDPSACNLSDTLIANPIPDTTGGNLVGSYPPGTTVQFCYTINQYSKVNCSYLEGIVPILGNGWDPTSFTITQMPASADGFGFWDWYTAATQPVTYNSTGDTVNKSGGFFYINNCMNCPVSGGDPDNSWGDGYCNGPCQCDITGSPFTWNLCFTVTTNSDCIAGTDLSVGIKTYADGEIGAWTELACGVDPLNYPAFASPGLNCANCAIASVSSTGVLCFGGSNGGASVTMDTTGTPPYTYTWDNGSTTSSVNNLTAGIHTVTVTDAAGCIKDTFVTITEPAAIATSLTATTVSCFGGANGSVDLTPSGGTPAYTYSWSNSATTQDIGSLTINTYKITLTDANGCTKIDSIAVTQPPDLGGTIVGTDAVCNGSTTGAADLTPSGGTPPYVYLWTTGATTQDVSGLTAGTFTVTITDSKGCLDSVSVIINQPTPLVAGISGSVDVPCNGDSTGTATASGTGGTPPYTFLWNDPLTQTTSTATGLLAGNYMITVFDNNNCSDTESVTINEPTPLAITISDTADAGCGVSNGFAVATPSGATPPYSYLWNDPLSQTDSTATGLSSGNYTVTVTDSKGCTGTALVNISNIGAPAASITDTAGNSCYGDSLGFATVTPSGGLTPYTYTWNDPQSQTDSIATGLPAGTFTITVTDAGNCQAVVSITITEPSQLILSASPVDILCFGDSSGSATVTPAGGTPPYSYLWNDAFAQTDSTATGLPSANYSVTVTDNNGCISTAAVIVNQPAQVVASVSSTVDPLCKGDSTGTASVTGSGGVAPFSFLWSDAGSQTTSTATGLPAGNYTVTITDVNGCTDTDNTSLADPTALTAAAAAAAAFCNGASDGTATVTPGGGTPPYVYNWNDPAFQTDSSATGLTAGTYNVTVTDNNGCDTSISVVVSEPLLLTVSVSSFTIPLCFGDSNGTANSTVTGGITPYTYIWDDPSNQTSPNVTGLPSGTYTLDVSDSNGCSGFDIVTIADPLPVSSIFSQEFDPLCFGDSNGFITVTPTGGTPPYSYLWNTGGQTDSTATGLKAGSYVVTITDFNGCTYSDVSTISDPLPISVIDSSVAVLCFGDSTGAAMVFPTGGTTPYSYQWNDFNSQTDSAATGLPAGNYSVTVTDADGCSGLFSVTVNQSAILSLSFSSANEICNASNGTATVTASGGLAPYSYLWDSNAGNQTGSIATGLSGGVYSVTITDANGCTKDSSVVVNTASAPAITFINSGNSTCAGSCDGFAEVTVSGGAQPYTYLWETSDNDSLATGLCSGYVSITVTDSAGCFGIDSISITEPAALNVSITSFTNVSCFAGSDGSATATAIGGIGTIIFAWNDPLLQTTSTAVGLLQGSYTIIVTDSNLCTAFATILLTEPTEITLSVSTQNVCSGSPGSATITSSGGTGSFTYLWDVSAGSQDSSTATGLFAGTYNVTVTDENSCSKDTFATLNSFTNPAIAALSEIDATCNGSCDGSAIATVAGGTPPYSYSWSNGQSSSQDTALCAATYTITVTDFNGCTADSFQIINEPVILAVSITSGNVTCYGGNDGSATAAASGGTPTYSYFWSNGNSTSVTTLLSAGGYAVTVTDGNGCIITENIIITEPLAVTVAFSGNTSICSGDSTLITASPGPSYTWSTGETTGSINVKPSGDSAYYVTVTDANGCTADSSVTIAVTQKPGADAGSDNEICFGESVQLAGSSQFGTSYSWVPPGSLSDPLIAQPAATPVTTTTYTLTVLNGNCSDADNIVVTVNSLPPVELGIDLTIEEGESVTLNAGSASIYLWSPVTGLNCSTCASPVATPLSSTTYQVMITDTNGCKNSDSLRITVVIKCETVFVPNIFSPGSNNTENKKLKVFGTNCVKAMNIRIFDRWGEMVFSATGGPASGGETAIGWDGTFKGKILNSGVFVYFLTGEYADGKPISLQGNVTIVK